MCDSTNVSEEREIEMQAPTDSTIKDATVQSDKSITKLSKKQLKRLIKKEQWQKNKATRRQKDKLKRRMKIEEAKREGRELGQSRKMLKSKKMADSSCQLRVAFDLSFDTLMTEAEMSKTIKQLHRCYSINRRADAPLQMYVSGYSQGTKDVLTKLHYTNWDVYFQDEPYSNVFNKEDVIYLTSDSENVLESLDQNKIYVIGALVDHNRLKGLTYSRSKDLGIGHACLPLGQYVDMKSRKVLTIDQVFLILLEFTQGKTWDKAFLNVIPKRKGIKTKSDLASAEGEDDDDTD